MFAYLGIPTYGMRECSKYRNDKNKLSKIHNELFLINFISTIIFLCIYVALIFCITNFKSHISLFLISAIGIALNLFNNNWLFEGLEAFDYISIRNIVFKILSFIALLLFVKDENDALVYLIITILGTGGNVLLNLFRTRKFVHFSFKNLNLTQHLKPLFFLMCVNIAIEIYSLVDVTMLGFLSDSSTVTFYSYGMKIYSILGQVMNTFSMVLVPRLTLLYKEKKVEQFNSLLLKTLIVILIVSVPMIVGIQFVSPYFITFIYGPEYIRSSNVINLLSINLLIAPVGHLLGSRIFVVTNNEKKIIFPVVTGALINVVLNFIFINLFLERGAAIASIISNLIMTILYVVTSRHLYTIKIKPLLMSIFKILISVFIMGIVCYFESLIKANLLLIFLLQCLSGALVYFTMLLILKEEVIFIFIKNFIFKIRRR